MDKKTLLILVVVALVIILGVFYFNSTKEDSGADASVLQPPALPE